MLRLEISPGRPLTHSITLPPLRQAPMRIWAHAAADQRAMRDHVANLNLILNGLNPAGIVFDLQEIARPPAEAWEMIGHDCRNEAAVRRSRWFDPQALNVYYHGDPGAAARCCHGGDMIFLGPGSPLGRLAHEAGHALGLRGGGDGSGVRYDDGHADSIDIDNPFTDQNVMWRANAALRSHLTLGQIAWMHGSERSLLVKLAGTAAAGRLPFWADDPEHRVPEPGQSDIEAALRARYERIVAYWDGGRRPEGRPGSASATDFVRRHKGELRQ